MKLKTKHKVNGVDMEKLDSTIDIVRSEPSLGKSRYRVTNQWIKGGHNQTTIRDFHAANQDLRHKHKFQLEADEPDILAGTDKAPSPVEHLLNALACCLTSAMVYHAAEHGIELHEVESEVEGDIDIRGFMALSEDVRRGFQDIRVKFRVRTDEADAEKLKTLAEFSPVYDTVRNGTMVDLSVETI